MNTSLRVIAVEITTKLSVADTYTSLHTPTWLISSLLSAAISVNSSEPGVVRGTQALAVYMRATIICVSVAVIPSGLVFLWCSAIPVCAAAAWPVDFRILLTDNSC